MLKPRPLPLFSSLLLIATLSAMTWMASIPALSQHLEYRADWWLMADYWRPFTAWLAQLHSKHWLINQPALWCLWVLLPKRLTTADLAALTWVWLLASFALLSSDYQQYAGLSGLLYGWLIWGVYSSPYHTRPLKIFLMVLLTAKVLHENWTSNEAIWVSDWLNAQVAVDAHLWGLVAGWLAVAAYQLCQLIEHHRSSDG